MSLLAHGTCDSNDASLGHLYIKVWQKVYPEFIDCQLK